MQNESLRRLLNTVIAVSALAIAGGVVAYLVRTRPEPPRRSQTARVPEVAIFAVEPQIFSEPVIGHGTIQPKRQVKIVPEVTGRLVQVHDDLAIGKVIPKGELLFEIDSRTYQLQVDQARAEIKASHALLERHREEQASLSQRIPLAERLLELAQKNYEREVDLVAGVGTTDVETVAMEAAALKQKDNVLGLKHQLSLIPHLIAETEALLDTQRAKLAEAERRLESTKIECPFDARVESVAATESQVVIASLSIATLTDMEALEVAAGIDPRDLRWTNLRAFARAVGQDLGNPPEAAVTWSLYDRAYTWRGPVTRLERVDAVTRTAKVVVEIRDFMRGLTLESGEAAPPLSVGMFCRVELPAEPLDGALVVPRAALHDGDTPSSKFVYVFESDAEGTDDAQGRLGVRRVPVYRIVDDQVLVSFDRSDVGPDALVPSVTSDEPDPATACELRPGEHVIVSVLSRAVPGMRVRRGSVVDDPFREPPDARVAIGTESIDASQLRQGVPPSAAAIAPPMIAAAAMMPRSGTPLSGGL